MTKKPQRTNDIVKPLIDEWNAGTLNVDPSSMAIVGRIIVLGRRFEKRVEEMLEDSGLTFTDFDLLATLRRSGLPYALTPTELRHAVLISSGAMTAALRRLEDRDLITRKADDQDRRVIRACLTDKGIQTIEPLVGKRFAVADKSIEGMGTRDREHAIKTLLWLLDKDLEQETTENGA